MMRTVCVRVCTCLSTWVSGATGCQCDEPQTVIGPDRQSEELPGRSRADHLSGIKKEHYSFMQ